MVGPTPSKASPSSFLSLPSWVSGGRALSWGQEVHVLGQYVSGQVPSPCRAFVSPSSSHGALGRDGIFACLYTYLLICLPV